MKWLDRWITKLMNRQYQCCTRLWCYRGRPWTPRMNTYEDSHFRCWEHQESRANFNF